MIVDAIERLLRRSLMMIGRGRVNTVNDSGPVQTVQVQLGATEIADNIPRLAEYGFTSNPPAQTDCLVVFLRGERSSGVIVGTNNQTARKKAIAVGEVAIYDNQGQFIHITRAGIVINGAGKPVTITGAPNISLDSSGNLVTAGNISDLNGAKGTVQHIRDVYDIHTHQDPQGGNVGTPSNIL